MRIINQSISFLLLNAFMLSSIHSQVKDNNPGPPGGNGLNVECVNQLIIDDFKSSKKWKVVVSGTDPVTNAAITEEISYKAMGQAPFNNMTWKLGNGSSENYWDLKPLLPSSWTQKGKAFIPANKLPTNNNDFGESYGVVKLERGTEVVLSTDPAPNPTKSMKVFFRRYDNNIHDNSVPNWFYYWTKIDAVTKAFNVPVMKWFNTNTFLFESKPNDNIQVEYRDNGGFSFDPKNPPLSYNPGGNDYGGGTKVVKDGSICSCPIGTINHGKLEVYGTSFANGKLLPNFFYGQGVGYWSIADRTLEGIKWFANITFHELNHYNIIYENWKDGYLRSNDCDDDGYNDAWEAKINLTLKAQDRFTIGIGGEIDLYNPKYNPNNLSGESAGTRYEETECNRIGKAMENSLNLFDWSFDPDGRVIGFNWK